MQRTQRRAKEKEGNRGSGESLFPLRSPVQKKIFVNNSTANLDRVKESRQFAVVSFFCGCGFAAPGFSW